LASSTDARLEDTTARRCSRCDLRSRARSMVVGERGTGGVTRGWGGGWRVKEVDLDLELCGGYILSTLVVICVVMWCWMRKKMKSKTRCSLLLCCSVALLLLLPCTVNKNRSHVAACRVGYDGGGRIGSSENLFHNLNPGNMWHHILTTTMPVHTT
jgi:hypothetical protein